MPSSVTDAVPTSCPARRDTLPALPGRFAEQPCFIFFDRHIHKNGGSTLRVLAAATQHTPSPCSLTDRSLMLCRC